MPINQQHAVRYIVRTHGARLPLPGSDFARATGRMVGMMAGAALGSDAIDRSARAMQATPAWMHATIKGLAQAGRPLTPEIRRAGRFLADAAVGLYPKLAFVAYAPDKCVDLAVGASASVFANVPWSYERPFVLRAPGAAYPDMCDRFMPAPGCPDPLSYVQAEVISVYTRTFLYMVLAAAMAGYAACSLWPCSVGYIARLSPEHIPIASVPLLQPLERYIVQRLIGAAQNAVKERHAVETL